MRERSKLIWTNPDTPQHGKTLHSILQSAENFLVHPCPASSSKQCIHCGNRTRWDRLQCRLCSHSFCYACCGHYLLPSHCRLPTDKPDQPLPVCLTCRNACYRFHTRVMHAGEDLVPRRTHMVRSRDQHGNQVHIHPTAHWETHAQSCFFCDRQLGKRAHPCRLCGERFCSECSIRMHKFVPTAFYRDKVGDTGRVCKDCRFHVFQGARLQSTGPTGTQTVLGADYWEDIDPQFDERRGKVHRLSGSGNDHRDILLKFHRMSQESESVSQSLTAHSASLSGDDDFSQSPVPTKTILLQELGTDTTSRVQVGGDTQTLLQLYHKCILRNMWAGSSRNITFLHDSVPIPKGLWSACYIHWMESPIVYKVG